MYKTVLVGIDDSEFSKAAVIEVANWIKRHGGKLILVHAVFAGEEEFGYVAKQYEKRLELGRKMCSKTEYMVVSEFGIEAEAIVRDGEPPEVITDIAHEQNADLIAMGTHGRRGLKRIFMGSVTSSVIVNSPCDVLVVKRPCIECTGIYSSILLTFDGSEFSKNALNRACQLSKIDGNEITVLYVIPRYQEMINFFKTESIKKSLLKEAQKIMDTAIEIASGHGVSIKTKIDEGHVGDEIVETAIKLKSDLIIMSTHGWRGFNKAIMGSTTQRVLIDAPCPILVVR